MSFSERDAQERNELIHKARVPNGTLPFARMQYLLSASVMKGLEEGVGERAHSDDL